jgi:hypothetical protein
VKRWITPSLVAGFHLLGGLQGICHESVKRPVVRFIDFYVAAEEAQRPPSVFERIAYGLALVAGDSNSPHK